MSMDEPVRLPRRCYFVLQADQFDMLVQAAELRRMRPRELANRLMHVITDENLIDAIMDDAGEIRHTGRHPMIRRAE